MTSPADTRTSAPSARVMIGLLLPLFASLMSISSVMVALPAIERGIGASPADLQWVLSGYALAFGVCLVPAGRAGDLWGRRRFFLMGVTVFGLSSLAAVFAPTPLVLNILRAVMGLGAAMLVPQIIGMIQRLFKGPARGKAYGLMSTVVGVAVAVGPLVGGALIDLAPDAHGFRLVFLVNVPVTALGLIAAVLWLPAHTDATSETADGSRRGLRRLDPVGAALLTVAIVCVMLPFIQLSTVIGLVVGLGGVALLVVWILWEKRLGQRDPSAPMVNLSLFTMPSYTWNSAVLVIYFGGMPGIWAVVALYVQQGLGHGAFLAGLITLPSAVMITLLAAQVGQRVERRGPQMLVIGTVTAVVSILMLAGVVWWMGQSPAALWLIAVSLGLNGVSQALIIPTSQTMSMADVPEYMAGAAGGVAQSAQRVVTAIGLALVTAVYFAVQHGSDHQTALTMSALVIGGVLFSAVLCAVGAAMVARRRV